MGERTTEYRTPRRAGEPAPPRPRTDYEAAIQPGSLRAEAVRPRPKTELRRVTVCEHDERLEVKSVRGIGFGARCTCGWRSRIYGVRDEAIRVKREHEDTHRD